MSYAGVSLGHLYLDVCSLLNVLAVANSSRCLLSDVTMSDTPIAHARPLALDVLNSSSLLAPLLIVYSIIRKYLLFGMGIISYFRCTVNPEISRVLQSISIHKYDVR